MSWGNFKSNDDNRSSPSAVAAAEPSDRTYEDCAAKTSYTSRVDGNPIFKGGKVCFRTTENRFALIEMLSDAAMNKEYVFDVTVWDPPAS